jgi:hypothetical protein
MWAQGCATLRLDSFTARGYHNVCSDTGQVRPSERAQDVLAAAYLLATRPDVRIIFTDPVAAFTADQPIRARESMSVLRRMPKMRQTVAFMAPPSTRSWTSILGGFPRPSASAFSVCPLMLQKLAVR